MRGTFTMAGKDITESVDKFYRKEAPVDAKTYMETRIYMKEMVKRNGIIGKTVYVKNES